MMDGVFLEPDGRLDLGRQRPDPNCQVHLPECGHELSIEVGDRSRLEPQERFLEVRRPDDEPVLEEVEFHREHLVLVDQRTSRQPSGREV